MKEHDLKPTRNGVLCFLSKVLNNAAAPTKTSVSDPRGDTPNKSDENMVSPPDVSVFERAHGIVKISFRLNIPQIHTIEFETFSYVTNKEDTLMCQTTINSLTQLVAQIESCPQFVCHAFVCTHSVFVWHRSPHFKNRLPGFCQINIQSGCKKKNKI